MDAIGCLGCISFGLLLMLYEWSRNGNMRVQNPYSFGDVISVVTGEGLG